MNPPDQSPFDRWQRLGFGVGLAGLVLCGCGAAFATRQFFISYLMGCLFWMGLSSGCLGVAMIHHLTGGQWGFVTRRFLEAGFMVLPVMALLFLPVLLGLSELYPWARPETVADIETLQKRQSIMNVPWFCARTIFFLAVWLTLAWRLRRWSLQQDQTRDVAPTIRMRAWSGVGLVVWTLTGTFAFVDWIMSAETNWFSSIFPIIIIIGQILTAYALITLMLAWLRERSPFRNVVAATHFHNLGNLLLAFVVFWTYVSFSQFLIIYSGNLPHEIEWYLHRTAGGWSWVAGFLALFHFLAPFALLLVRATKRSPARLAALAAMIFCVHVVETFWMIQPSFHHGVHIHWLDFAAVAGVGGIWVGVFALNLKRQPLLPRNDPRIEFTNPRLAHAE